MAWQQTYIRFKACTTSRGVSSRPVALSLILGLPSGFPGPDVSASATILSYSCIESASACTFFIMVWVCCTASTTWSSNFVFFQFVAVSARFCCLAPRLLLARGAIVGGMAFTFSNKLCNPTFLSTRRGGRRLYRHERDRPIHHQKRPLHPSLPIFKKSGVSRFPWDVFQPCPLPCISCSLCKVCKDKPCVLCGVVRTWHSLDAITSHPALQHV